MYDGGDNMELSENALKVLERRYLAKDENGNIIETPEDMMRRVARTIASADLNYGKNYDAKKTEEEFFNLMSNLKFIPNSPTLMNAGRPLGQLSACFVLPIEDSMEGIFDSVKNAALIHKSGGGTGFSFSRLRAKGSAVATTGGVASGPISFMKVFNSATEAVKQGGCVSRDTLVATGNGIMRIDEIGPCDAQPKSWHKHNLKVVTDEGIKDSDEFYNNGHSKTITLKTKCGYTVTATEEHRFRVINEAGEYAWKHLKDIKAGDYIVLQKDFYIDNGNYKFPEYNVEPHFNATKINIPKFPTEELGEFIGYFMGDGALSINEHGTGRLILTIADKEEEIKNRMIYITEKIFGLTPCAQKKPDDNSTNYFFNSTVLTNWLRFIGVDKKSSIDANVPEVIFKGGKSFAKGFIRGLFSADGCVTKEGYPSLCTISEKMADGLRILLLSIGIPTCTSIKSDRKDAFGDNPIYQIRIITNEGIRKFKDEIGFIVSEKNERLNNIEEASYEFNDIIPNQAYKLKEIYDGPGRGCAKGKASRGANRELYRDISHYLPDVSAKRNLTRMRLKYLAKNYEEVKNSSLMWFLENNQFYDEVVELKGSEALTLDLSVPENSTYIANGFVSHNTRRGANMAILRVDHPDIMEFIKCKEDTKEITNFNISVALTEKFMEAAQKGEDYDLIDPHTKKAVGKLNAREVFDLIVKMAWTNGEPGIVFIDRMNRDNPTPSLGEIESTNPCGEQPLLPYESCNLGSINLVKMLKENGGKYEIDYKELERTVKTAVHFLDNVIDVNKYPLDEIDKMTKSTRKIGLGIMGFADMLMMLNIPYNSEKAVKLAENIMKFINEKSKEESRELAKVRGAFPAFENSIYKDEEPLRNATTTTIAPTGTISIIGGVSSGVEPLFAVAFVRNVMDNDKLVEVYPYFEKVMKERGLYSKELMMKVAKEGTIAHIKEIPEDIKKVFVTAHDITPVWHIRMQAAFQKYTDNAVSKTVNFRNDASEKEVRDVFTLAYKLGCKGVTIYRDGSRSGQVLNVGTDNKKVGNISGDDGSTPRERPQLTKGITEKVRVGCGNLYVTVNYDENGICEVFTNVGKAGGCPSQSEATARLISIGLRSGMDVESIIHQLKGIRCHSTLRQRANNKDIKVLSCPDAIARTIEKLMNSKEIKNCDDETIADNMYINDLIEEEKPKKQDVCPECGNKITHADGCVICPNCGYSKCS